ncbi:MAG: DNRLRE domain-containing protein [Planctomycetes bacterium]|nr:DNRLRE domain-containing protein [Planctomycetota bacterium]
MLRRVLLLPLAALALGVCSAAAPSQISIAGYVFDDHAAPDFVVLEPGASPEFASSASNCLVVPSLPGLTPAESASQILGDDGVDGWVFGRAVARLEFTDNVVMNGPGPDLVVFEIGGAESFALSIFVESLCEWSDPRSYMPVATGFSSSPCGTVQAINAKAIDLADFGVLPGATVRRVRIDNKGAPGGAVGADLALVMAQNSLSTGPAATGCLLEFEQGLDAGFGTYAGAADTCLASDFPTTNYGAAALEYSDSSAERDLLMRFDGIVGGGPGQIAPGAVVEHAWLTVTSGAGAAASNGTHRVHRVLQPWNAATVTWANSFGGDGVDADGVEAEATPVGSIPAMAANTSVQVDVTAAVQAWVDGEPNRGFVILADTTDGLGLNLAEASVVSWRPGLTVQVRGTIGFAGAVTAFAPTVINGEPSACNLLPEFALGAPDWFSDPTPCCAPIQTTVTLGKGGVLTLEFLDVSISGDGTPEPDLWIYERGGDVEDTYVDVSADLVAWTSVGKVLGSVSSIDLDGFGIGPLDLFRYVRLTDDPAEGAQAGCTVGADIDSVAALAPNPWLDVGGGAAGTLGVPRFTAAGALVGGDTVEFLLTNAPPAASAYFVLGVSALFAPFKGGVLVPNPDLVVGGLPTGPLGVLGFGLTWPLGVPAGLPIWIQDWILDAGATYGFAGSNGISSITR